jgi:hypothetical protein
VRHKDAKGAKIATLPAWRPCGEPGLSLLRPALKT